MPEPEAALTDDEQQALALLAVRTFYDRLVAEGIDCTLVDEGVLIGELAAVGLENLYIHHRPSGGWIAMLELCFALRGPDPEFAAWEQCANVGDSAEEAVVAVAGLWFSVMGPALLTVLTRQPHLGAIWLQDGAELGLPGWQPCLGPHSFQSPESENRAAIVAFVEEQPVLARIADALLEELVPGRLNFVKLFWTRAGAGHRANAEVTINGQDAEQTTLQLLNLPWPQVTASTRLWQYIVLVPDLPDEPSAPPAAN